MKTYQWIITTTLAIALAAGLLLLAFAPWRHRNTAGAASFTNELASSRYYRSDGSAKNQLTPEQSRQDELLGDMVVFEQAIQHFERRDNFTAAALCFVAAAYATGDSERIAALLQAAVNRPKGDKL